MPTYRVQAEFTIGKTWTIEADDYGLAKEEAFSLVLEEEAVLDDVNDYHYEVKEIHAKSA